MLFEYYSEEVTDEELDHKVPIYSNDARGFLDCITETEPYLEFFNGLGIPRGEYDYSLVIRLLKRVQIELARLEDHERMAYDLEREVLKGKGTDDVE